MSKGLYYYKLQSPYPEDVTKNCKLTINEIDSNFLSLKDEDIKSAVFDKESKAVILTRNDGDTIAVDLSDATYNLNVDKDCTDSGVTLTITFDGKNGQESFTINNIVTADTFKNFIENNVLSKVITDGTLKGDGTVTAPLGLNGTEKTGVLAPVKEVIDLTNGRKLPTAAKKGTRYLTIEYINDYGYLYNVAALSKISNAAKADGKGWRVPSKADWDALLNSIEPCSYANHETASCHAELGRYAGKYLKSECGWVGQEDCACASTKPMNGCELPSTDNSYVDADDDTVPPQTVDTPKGIDKYGFGIFPSGYAMLDGYNRPSFRDYKNTAIFWTTSHVYGDENQDIYVKKFDWNKSGVMQEAQCPTPYFSVRLVKDYDGSNYFDTEYIDGVAYKTVLMPKSKQVWLASNYAKKEGFIKYTEGGEVPEVVDVNNGQVRDNRKVMFINEWNGDYWEKRPMNEGETVIVEDNCSMSGSSEVKTICWSNEDGEKECVEVEIPTVVQNNLSYRVYTTENCDQALVNVDDLAIERILNTIIPIIENERKERLESESEIRLAISAETQARISGDTELSRRLELEENDRKTADTNLWAEINNEKLARENGDAELSRRIDEETSARTEADNAIEEKINSLSGDTNASLEAIRAAISAETKAREDADADLETRLNGEVDRAKEAEKGLHEEIVAETERATQAENSLSSRIDEEVARATSKENEINNQLVDTSKSPFTMNIASGKDVPNIVIPSKDNLDSHAINIMLDSNFGEI